MAKYQIGVTAFASLDMAMGMAKGTVFLLCEDCGWIKYQATDVHLLKHEHDSSCQAMKWSRDRYAFGRPASLAEYSLIPLSEFSPEDLH